MPLRLSLPHRAPDALAAVTLAAALLASAHNVRELAKGHAPAMRCGGPQPGVVCRVLCWIGGR